MKAIVALVLGALFGAGLIISGMTDPAKVLGFLDVAGRWDPALGVVMAAALAVTIPVFTLARRRGRAVLGGEVADPRGPVFDMPLLAGSALFGVGWGLAGICPGPALALLGQAPLGILAFLLAQAAGTYVARALLLRLGGTAEAVWEG